MDTTFFSLASKSNFNKALRHFTSVTEIVDEIESDKNLADVVNELIVDDGIVPDQILPIVGAVIRDKYAYSFDTFNIPVAVTDFSKISTETAKWTALDIVLVYYSPIDKIFLINPKNINHWEKINDLSKVLYRLFILFNKIVSNPSIKINCNIFRFQFKHL